MYDISNLRVKHIKYNSMTGGVDEVLFMNY